MRSITITALFLSAVISLSERSVFAAVSQDDSYHTVWDQIMVNQSYRNMDRGAMLMDSGNYKEAATYFGKAVVSNPKDAMTHIMLGASLYWMGQVDQAMTEYDAALQIDPKNAQAYQLKGIVYAWKDDIENALASFLKAEEYAPDKADVEMNIGSIYEAMNKVDLALDKFRRAVELDPKHPLYHYQLGELYDRLERSDDAIASLKKAIDLYGDFQDAILAVASVYEKTGNDAEAIKYYKRAVKLKPMDSAARYRLSLALVRVKDLQAAGEVLAGAFSLMPYEQNDGLALSMSYAGVTQRNTPSPEGQPQKGPGDSLRRSLEKLPLDQNAEVDVDLVYLSDVMPKLEIMDENEELGGNNKGAGKKSSLKKALDKKAAQPKAMTVKRTFNLPPASPDQRQEQIDKLVSDINNAASAVPKGAEMHMAMSIQTSKKAASGEGQNSGGGNGAPGGTPSSGGQPGKVIFNPHNVGNDMGLWVKGSGWLDLITDVQSGLTDSLDSAAAAPGEKYAAAGLGFVILGRAGEAMPYFEKAVSSGAAEEGYLGMAVAWVEMGDEDKAIAACEKALSADRKSKVAAQNLKWLKMPSNVSK